MKEKNTVHYFEVSDIISQFVSAFDSIIIGRFTGKTLDAKIPVRFTYAPKQAVIHALGNKAEHMTVPVISVSLSNISRDRDRVQSKNIGHYINRISETDHIEAPVPVNITVNMSIITRYQEDMDQILANFIPYSNPYIILSWKLPNQMSTLDTEIRSEVLWSEDVSLTQPIERSDSDRYRNIADTSFTIKTYLFKRHQDDPYSNIYEIDSDFYPISEYSDLFEELDVVDSLGLSAYPVFTFQDDVQHVVGTSPIQKLEGNNFSYTDNVYLSADTDTIFERDIIDQGDFNGIKLFDTEYDIIDDNVIYVNIPTLNDVGNISIIVENQAGYEIKGEIPIVTL